MDGCDPDKVSSTAIIHYLSQNKKKKKPRIRRLSTSRGRTEGWKIRLAIECFLIAAAVNSIAAFTLQEDWCKSAGLQRSTCRLEVVIPWVKKQHDHFISLSRSHVARLSSEKIPETFYPFFGCLLFELQWFVRCANSPSAQRWVFWS